MTLWVKVKPIKVNHHPAKFGGYRLCGSGDIFSLSSDFSRPHDQNIMRMYGWEPLPCLVALDTGSEDILLLVHSSRRTYLISK